jgi:hypothetical protein
MFGTVFDKLQTAFATLFSAAFLLGNFFPVLIIAIVNFGLAWIAVDGFSETAASWNPVTAGVANAAAEFLLLVLLAILLGPLVPVLRSLLDGTKLPPPLRRNGEEEWQRVRTDLQHKAETAKGDYEYFAGQADTSIGRLQQARAQGNNQQGTDENAVNLAQVAVRLVARGMQGGRLPQRPELEAAVGRLEQALRQSRTNIPDGQPHHDLAVKLDGLHEQLLNQLYLARDVAKRNADVANYVAQSNFAPNEIWPTRVGNVRAAIERYPTVAYKISYDFLWPRLRAVLLKRPEISVIVDTAQAKLDFAVLMTWLSALTVAGWLLFLALAGHSLLLYFVVGILGPAAVVLFYWLVDETQKAFGEVLVMAVDALHFDLLGALHQRIPNTLAAERETWMQLQRALYAEGTIDLRYHHPPKTS